MLMRSGDRLMKDLFPIYEVQDDAAQAAEAMGSKYKFWFLHSELGESLLKIARPNTGEDWSEKIAAELCERLGLPHAQYELAIWNQQPGVISPTMLPKKAELQHGNDILAGLMSSYPSDRGYGLSQHTLDIILRAISRPDLKLPIGWEPPSGIETAVDTFVGYLLLDAWIGNSDRHHENWGFVSFKKQTYLAPVYDNAASLGRELLDSKRQKILDRKDVEAYVEKSRSALYDCVEDKKAMLTLDAFRKIARIFPQPARVWLNQVSNISSDETKELLSRVPAERLSPSASEFAYQILEINKCRLLSLWEEFS
jgi:hypothetical protein